MTAFLYRTEAKGIQAWILASDRLLELRGGSNILVRLDEEIQSLAAQCGAEVVVATAGGATLRFSDEKKLKAFAEHWPFYVSQRAPGLQVVQAWDPDITAVYKKLGEARNIATADIPAAGPLVARSGRTGLPAVQRSRRDRGLDDRIIRAKVAELKEDEDALREALLGEASALDFVRDADDFGDGYLGVIHIDGNSVGRQIIDIGGNLDKLRKFSEKLKAATTAAAQAAFKELIRRQAPAPSQRILARPIILGGDDMTAIVHGRFAIPFAEFYLREFEKQTDSLEREGFKKVTASAGIALVKSGWPFIQAHALAQDLCHSAKRNLQRRAGVLFHRITTPDADLRWDHIASRELNCGGNRVLAGGPWEILRLQQLDELCVAAATLPRGGLRGWLGESRVSSNGAQFRWDRLREVAKERGTWTRFEDALVELRVNPATGWDGDRTPIPDALMWMNLQSTADSAPERLWSVS